MIKSLILGDKNYDDKSHIAVSLKKKETMNMHHLMICVNYVIDMTFAKKQKCKR